MAKKFYAQRLAPETIAQIKAVAAAWQTSEADAIARMFKKPDTANLSGTGGDSPCGLLNGIDLRTHESVKQPILKPSGRIA